MNTDKGTAEEMISTVGELAKTQIELLKLKAVKNTAITLAALVTGVIVGLLILLMLLMVSIGIAYWIGRGLGNVADGFFIIGGAYLLIGSVLYLFRKKWIVTMIQNKIINKMANS